MRSFRAERRARRRRSKRFGARRSPSARAMPADRRARAVRPGVRLGGAARERVVSRRVSPLRRAVATADRFAARRSGMGVRRRRRRARMHGEGQRPSPHRVGRPRAGPRDRTLGALARPPVVAARRDGLCARTRRSRQRTLQRPYSIDANLWGRSIEAGVLEDPWAEPPEDAYAWTAAPRAPAAPEET